MDRRSFLALLAGGAGIVAAAPVRRYWQVGAALERPQSLQDWWESTRLGLEGRGARFAHIRGRGHDDDLLHGIERAVDDQLAEAISRGYIVCDDIMDASPIVVRTVIGEGYRS